MLTLKFTWFKPSGKYYTSGDGQIERVAWDRFFLVGDLAAFHMALLRDNGNKLPGLNSGFTDLAVTVECTEQFPHHFQAGTFSNEH